jgi:hypothetical protein
MTETDSPVAITAQYSPRLLIHLSAVCTPDKDTSGLVSSIGLCHDIPFSVSSLLDSHDTFTIRSFSLCVLFFL